MDNQTMSPQPLPPTQTPVQEQAPMQPGTPQPTAVPPQKPKSIRWIIVMMVLPFILLAISLVLAIFSQFVFNKVSAQVDVIPIDSTSEIQQVSDTPTPTLYDSAADSILDGVSAGDAQLVEEENNSTLETAVSVVQLLLGIAAVILLMLEPLWIILLILALNHNKKISSNPTA